MKRQVGLAATLCLMACGGSGSFTGAVDGKTMSVHDAIFVVAGSPTSNESDAKALWLVLSSSSDRCAQVGRNELAKNSTDLVLGLFKVPAAGASASLTTGSYGAVDFATLLTTGTPATTLSAAFGAYLPYDAACAAGYTEDDSAKYQIASGSVNLGSYDAKAGGVASGDFTLVFGPQKDSTRGTFTAKWCDALAAQFDAEVGGNGASASGEVSCK